VSPITHGALAWLLALVLLKNIDDRRLVVIAGVLPDIDGIFVLFNEELFQDYHHTFGHYLIFGILLSIAVGLIGEDKKKVIITAFGAFLLHLIADIIGAWSVHPFYPVYNQGFSANMIISYDIIQSIIHPAINLTLIALVISIAYFKEISPIEFISAKLDKTIVGFYVNPLKYRCRVCEKRALIECSNCNKKYCAEHSKSLIKAKCGKCGG
jgi:membrane-bound metal-dependent hydrolase YbcI (DUF457 family)